LQKAGRNRVAISHAVGAANDGRYALIKAVLFGGAVELYALPAGLTHWLIDRIGEAVTAGAIRGRHPEAVPGSPEAQQLAMYAATRCEIDEADWERGARRIVGEIHAHAFGNALGLMMVVENEETPLILPDQVAILLHESLTLVATYLMDRTHPFLSGSEH
jgi:hypothetical protein